MQLGNVIFALLLVFGANFSQAAATNAKRSSDSGVGNEVVEEPRTPIEIDLSGLRAHVTVVREGTQTNGGPDIPCGFSRPRHESIRGSGTSQLEGGPVRILENKSEALSLVAPATNHQNEIESSRRPVQRPKQWFEDWRTLTISNVVTRTVDQTIVQLNLKDFFRKAKSDSSRDEDCTIWGDCDLCSTSQWTDQIEKDTLSGHLDITYEMPERTSFIKIEVIDATGVFAEKDLTSDRTRVSIVGGIHPFLLYDGPTYAWYKKTDDGRIRIRFNFNTLSMGAGGPGLLAESQFKVRIRPILPPRGSDIGKIFSNVMGSLADPSVNEDQLVVELGTLISNFSAPSGPSVTRVLDQTSLKQIRETQAELFRFAISASNEHKGFTPTTKAMAAVLATSIAEHLSQKLLNICRLKTKQLILTNQTVNLPGYVYLTFYVQRVIRRLESLQVQDLYQFAKIVDDVEQEGLSFKEVAADRELMRTLGDTHRIYVSLVAAASQPVRTSEGEMAALARDVGGFFRQSNQYQSIMSGLRDGLELEKQIQSKIAKTKRLTVTDPKSERFTGFGAWHDVQALDAIVKDVHSELLAFTQDSMFSEISKSGIRESMFEIFKGVNLREVDWGPDVRVQTFYQPIFEYFFNPAGIEKINSEAKLCLAGELK